MCHRVTFDFDDQTYFQMKYFQFKYKFKVLGTLISEAICLWFSMKEYFAKGYIKITLTNPHTGDSVNLDWEEK